MFFSNKKIVFIEENKGLLNNSNVKSMFSSAQILYSLNSLESCAYINLESSTNSFLSLLEQFFLRTKIQKEYPYIHIDYYLKFNSKFLTRGILSQAEYQNIAFDKLEYMLNFYRYNTIIIEGFSRDSQYLELLLNIIKSSSITSNIVIIGDENFKKYLEKSDVIFSNFFKFNYVDNSQNISNLENSHEKINKNVFLSAPKEIQSWLLIAQNFIYLKENYTKRFFFISNIHNYSKEIIFVTFLKKYTKELQDAGNWDLMVLSPKESNLLTNVEYNKQFNLIKQSFSIEGFTNLIISDDLNLDFEEKLLSSLFVNDKQIKTNKEEIHNNSIIFITSQLQIDTKLQLNFHQKFIVQNISNTL